MDSEKNVSPQNELFYTDDLKNILDQRYNDSLHGKVELVGAKESKEKIAALLAAK